MKGPAPADLQRWSEELARNPASLAFLPLARAYRRIGRRDAAKSLTVRGLEAHPGNVEAHALLALLYLEEGDRARAADEWSIVLRLKPGNFEALRGMGFRYLEQNDIPRARQHLERAALIRPDDTAVREALRLLRQREAAARPERGAPRAAPPAGEPSRAPEAPDAAAAAAGNEPVALELTESDAAAGQGWSPYDAEPPATGRAEAAPARPEAAAAQPAAAAKSVEEATPAQPAAASTATEVAMGGPATLFDDVMAAPNVRGALLLDPRGLVLAGALRGGVSGDDAGAILGSAVDEAVRTVEYLGLGGWKGLLMETGEAVVHVRPIEGQGVTLLAVEPGSPTGWVLRTADTLAARAASWLEAPR